MGNPFDEFSYEASVLNDASATALTPVPLALSDSMQDLFTCNNIICMFLNQDRPE